MDTNMDTKQAATANSAATSTSTNTPGAVHVDVPISSMKGKQAFQQTNLTSGPSYYPEDDQQQQLAARRLEQESAVSSERAAAKSCNEKTEAKLKQVGKSKKQTLRDEKLKRAARSDRQGNHHRRERIVARTTGEVTKPPTKSVSPSQNAEQDHEDIEGGGYREIR
jgi:hypothetical protein